MAKQIFSDGPAFIFFADEVCNWYSHGGKENFTYFLAPFNKAYGPHFDTGCIQVDKNKADTFLWFSFLLVRTRQNILFACWPSVVHVFCPLIT